MNVCIEGALGEWDAQYDEQEKKKPDEKQKLLNAYGVLLRSSLSLSLVFKSIRNGILSIYIELCTLNSMVEAPTENVPEECK